MGRSLSRFALTGGSQAVLATGRASGSLPNRRTYTCRSSWSCARSRSLIGSALPAAIRRCKLLAFFVTSPTVATSICY